MLYTAELFSCEEGRHRKVAGAGFCACLALQICVMLGTLENTFSVLAEILSCLVPSSITGDCSKKKLLKSAWVMAFKGTLSIVHRDAAYLKAGSHDLVCAKTR